MSLLPFSSSPPSLLLTISYIFPFLFLCCCYFWAFWMQKPLHFGPFSLKWLQISPGKLSKTRLNVSKQFWQSFKGENRKTEEGQKRRKTEAVVVLLVLILATLETVFSAVTFSKIQLDDCVKSETPVNISLWVTRTFFLPKQICNPAWLYTFMGACKEREFHFVPF